MKYGTITQYYCCAVFFEYILDPHSLEKKGPSCLITIYKYKYSMQPWCL